ncbi:hypothetical protein ACIOWI_29815 [Streptomyces sp. NPDC087659]|uniref:hypothetical protein n=1 Tax=Streptomyces sp. NPDC087659 TaxID=3365801 RepID=UPI0037F65972
MSERLTFVLDGRDQLSQVLGHAGDSAIRLRDTMTDAADGSNRALLTLTRDADGRLRDLRGQFVSTADAARLMGSQINRTSTPIADWARFADRGRSVGEKLRGMLISLAPAAIPAAASLAPIAAGALAAGAAVGIFGAALIPQIAAISEATEAEKKYQDAVEEHGRSSKQATEAQQAYVRAMAKLPPQTREAAAALSVFKDEFKEWSNELSADTMGPFTKGLAVAGSLFPKLTPVVRGTSAELDRMMTLLAGGMETPGFDRTIGKFEQFSTRTLRRVNDGIVDLSQNLDTGEVGGDFTEFMQFARENGPVVGDTLRNIARALVNVLVAGADVGVGMLQVVDVLSELVAAVPPEALATLFQLAIAIKLVTLASVGAGAARAGIAALVTQIALARVAAQGATGTMGRLSAAFNTLSRTARLAVAGTGVGLLLIAMMEISEAAKPAVPDVDKLAESIKNLGEAGKFTGQLKTTFGDMDGFVAKVNQLRDASSELDAAKPFTSFLPGARYLEGAATKLDELINGTRGFSAAKGELGAFAEAFAQLARSGHADLAASEFKRFEAALRAAGMTTAEISAHFQPYQDALAAIKNEQDLAARGMGLFGQQAVATKQKLDGQKASADGLRQSIQALNEVNRQGLSGMIGFEAALDAASKAAKENAGALKMKGGVLDLSTEKSRNAATALNDLAAKTDEATASARESGASWSTVNGIYTRGREKLIQSAQAMGLTRAQAKALADQILKTPDKTARLKGNMEDLQAKLNAAKKRLASVPDSRKAAIRAEISQLEAAIREARIRMTSIDGRTAHTYIYTHHIVTKSTGEARKRKPGKAGHYADGGLIRGPGTGRSDSIHVMASDYEFIVNADQTRRNLPLLQAINDGKVPPARMTASLGPRAAAPALKPAALPYIPATLPRSAGGGGTTIVQVTVNGALDPMAVGRQVDQVLTKYKRNRGGKPFEFEG